MTNTLVRWGLMSTARINERLIPGVRRTDRSELVAVASRNLDRAKAYAAKWDIPRAHGSYEDLLADPDVDAVYISLPNSLHLEWAVKSAEAGKHILCEKPVALTPGDVAIMQEAARKNGVTLHDATMMRYHAQTFRLRELIADGAIGDVRVMRGLFNNKQNDHDDIRHKPDMGGGSLWDTGSYAVTEVQEAVTQDVETISQVETQTFVEAVEVEVVRQSETDATSESEAKETQETVVLDPVTAGAWTEMAELVFSRSLHTATLMPDGRLLVIGGQSTPCGSYGAVQCEELLGEGTANLGSTSFVDYWDAQTGTWTPAESMNYNRHSHGTVILRDRRIMVMGGSGKINDGKAGGAQDLSTAEAFDPATGQWTELASMSSGRQGPSATVLADGRVLVVGGVRFFATVASAEIYDPATDTWVTTVDMAHGRQAHTAILLPDGRVLVIGGGEAKAPLISVEAFDPETGNWTEIAPMIEPRTTHTATLLAEGRVLVTGGSKPAVGGEGAKYETAEIYDPATDAWTATGSMNLSRGAHTATLLPNGRVLVTGGSFRSASGAKTDTAEIYDPASGTWTTVASMAEAKDGHTATLLIDGSVVTTGGRYLSESKWAVEVFDPSG